MCNHYFDNKEFIVQYIHHLNFSIIKNMQGKEKFVTFAMCCKQCNILIVLKVTLQILQKSGSKYL